MVSFLASSPLVTKEHLASLREVSVVIIFTSSLIGKVWGPAYLWCSGNSGKCCSWHSENFHFQALPTLLLDPLMILKQSTHQTKWSARRINTIMLFRWYVEQRHAVQAWSRSLWKKLQRVFSSKRAGAWLRLLSKIKVGFFIEEPDMLVFCALQRGQGVVKSSSRGSLVLLCLWPNFCLGGWGCLQCGQVPQGARPWQRQHHSP